MDEDEVITCRDGCKRAVATPEEAEAAGWQFLEVQKRWRCPDCHAELEKINHKDQS